ncbi:8445_t:CDS:2 [Funneliformis geosporum]|uniref:8445_t:CDS:1 n=1 Tax=Funneliformis geosporum TaxID=1117311 RepID=A0A9W4WT66_9GLOM|nr:8445_t:CDS:2 [Funneliformis geosporum]
MNELQIIFYTSQDYYDSKKQHRKREPNMFTSFRKEKMKRRPANVPIDEYIKDVRRIWKGMSEVENLFLVE